MRRVRRAAGDDRGISVIEMVVAMGIFAMVVSVFMAGVVVMTRNTVRSQVVSDSGDSLRETFQRLDKQVRYADAINLEGTTAGGVRYVEFRTPATIDKDGKTWCTQWRWDPTAQVLQYRKWDQAATTLPGFTTMVSHVVTQSGSYPFDTIRATPDHPRQSLQVTLVVKSQDRELSESSEFVARNSTVESSGNKDTNNDGVSDAPACWRTGVRP